jgi:NADH-quinone oxidoreductase subunit M
MAHWPLLSLLTFLPLLGVGGILIFSRDERVARWIALGTSLVVLGLAVGVAFLFDPANADFQFLERARWIPSLDIVYRKGIDGLALVFVLLSGLLTPLAILSGFSIKERVPAFMAALLILETMVMGVFTSLDLVLFYFFFEGALIPLFLLIGIWGGAKRVYAAIKFFLMTFAGSVLMLVAVFAMAAYAGTTDMTALMNVGFPKSMALWLWLAFFASFAIKTPLWPFHTWLPYAHGEAPTAGSVLLAGVLLKMGAYGFIRIGIQMLPQASAYFAPFVMALGAVAVIYTSLVALAQTDFKRLIAYASVAHMGIVTIGLFAGQEVALDGAVFVMLSHGLVSCGLFLSAGVLYDRMHTRELARFGGVTRAMPRYATVFMILMLASIGLPGTGGFVGEFLTLLGVFQANNLVAALAALGLVLGAAYMLRLYALVFNGPPRDEAVRGLSDLSAREIAMFVPLLALIFWMGLYPAPLRSLYGPSVAKIASVYEKEIRP